LLNNFPKVIPFGDNVEEYGTARQATEATVIRPMRYACWITKATDTHSEYVVLIIFPRQKYLQNRALILPWTHSAYLFWVSVANF